MVERRTVLVCRSLHLVCCAGNITAEAVADVQQIADIVKHNAFGSGEWFEVSYLLVSRFCLVMYKLIS